MVKQPCEIIVNYILPSVRAQLSKELVRSGMSQRKVSNVLQVTPAAVSQYISGKRGYALEFEGEALDMIREMAERIIEEDDIDIGVRVCDVCSSVWNQATIDQLEERFEGITEGCSLCAKEL